MSHNNSTLREEPDYAEVVGNDEGGDAGIALDVADEVEDLGLYGDVEAGGGFVQDQERRPVRQRFRELHPLAHPAGEVARSLVHPVRRGLGLLQQLRSPAPHLPDMAPVRRQEALDHVAPGGYIQVQSLLRRLVDDADVEVAELPFFGGVGDENVPAAEGGEAGLAAGGF